MAEGAVDARLKHPFNMILAGPTQSGKSTWAKRLLLYADDLLEKAPSRVFWHSPTCDSEERLLIPRSGEESIQVFYRAHLPWAGSGRPSPPTEPTLREERKGDVGDGGIPIVECAEEEEVEEEEEPQSGDLIIIDDFAQEISNSKDLTSYITRHSHHRGISIILLSQNLFWSGKETRTQSLNMHYIVLMRQSRDHRQIRTLGRQLTQNQSAYEVFLQAYNDATETRPFSYLLVSLHPRDDKRLLLRANIFPEEANSATVYLQRPPAKTKRV